MGGYEVRVNDRAGGAADTDGDWGPIAINAPRHDVREPGNAARADGAAALAPAASRTSAMTFAPPSPSGATPEPAISDANTAEELIAWSLKRFRTANIVITTSFGMEGCALIDMYARHGRQLTVAYLDTMFFFPETYALRDEMMRRYPHLRFENRGTTLTPEEQERMHGPELWKSNPTLCCQIRKVQPMFSALRGVDVWVTGLMRSQSATRANIGIIEWDWKYQVLKFNPLATWTRQQVWTYVQEHNVPYNKLHERGYPTVGCTHCTKAVEGAKLGEYTRLGRWSEFEKTECGLHGGAGI